MRNFWSAFLPLVGTVGTLAALAAAGVGSYGLMATGAALTLTAGRREPTGSPAAELARVPLVALAVAGLGLVFSRSLATGDVLFVAVFATARLAWRFGPTAAAVGRAVLLPLIALFVAPPVALADRPVVGVLQVLLACVVAALWTVSGPRLWPAPAPSVAPLARAARRAVRPATRWPASRWSGAAVFRRTVRASSRWSGAAARRHRAVGAAALALDAESVRLAVLQVEHAVHQVRTGAATPHAVEAALTAVRTALPADRTAPTELPAPAADRPTGGGSGDGRAARRAAVAASVRTRLAVQGTVGVALALLAGQQLFGPHWPWTVLTVLTVGLRAASRGEVAVTAVERLLGAAAGTVVATLVGARLHPAPAAGTAVILAVLGAGMALRPYGYAWWAAAMTAALGLLYGLLGEPGGASVLADRLLAIGVGGVCAVLPAALLAPVRTRTAVRRRVGATVRTVGAALRAGPTVAAVRAADRELELLRTRARPLRLARPGTAEARWARTLDDCGPRLHAALLDPAAARPLGATLRTLAAEVTAA